MIGSRSLTTSSELRKLIACVENFCNIKFAEAANAFLRKAQRHDGAFSVDIKHSSRAAMFFVMTGIGFFRRAGMVYEMVISRQLTVEIINEALLLLLETKG